MAPTKRKNSAEDELVQLMGECAGDPLKFVMVAFPWGERGTELERFDGPDVWQREVLNGIKEDLTKGLPIQIATASGHGVGKAHPGDMELHTPRGLVRWGGLKVGDLVFSDKGKPVKIIGQQRYENCPIYRVSFNDGSFTDVSSGHLWKVRGRQERRNKLETWRVLETQEILRLGVKRSNGKALARQWEIPVQGVAEFRKKKVPILPYMLGVWLGDGSRNRAMITSADGEVVNRIRELGYDIKSGVRYAWNIRGGLGVKLRKMGIFDKYSYQKSVPVEYLENNIETRAEVLRGLLDTDGEVNTQGTTIFSSTSHVLAKDVMWLVRSLGGKAMMQPTVKKPFFNDANGGKKAGRDCWRVTIQMPKGFKSFYIKRKQERIEEVEARYLNRWIDKIEFIGNQDAMCISVPGGLYLANDFIVTHNSSLVSWLILWAMATREFTRGVVTANTESQLRTKTWPELAKWHRLFIARHWFDMTATSIRSVNPQEEQGWRTDAIPWSAQNTESFAGLHNQGKRILVIFDEASAVDDVIWETISGALTDEGTEIVWAVFGNPTRNTGRFRECFGRFAHRWRTWRVDSRSVRITNKKAIEQWLVDYGEDSDYVRVRVKGEFPRAGSMQFIPGDIVEAARGRQPEAKLYDPLVMGVDVARFGADQSVIVLRRGRDAKSVPWICLRGANTMELAARIVDLAAVYKPDAIFVDEGGVGGGVVDRLNMLKQPVIGVQFGGKADRSIVGSDGMIGYANKRAEMWGNMKDWLRGGMIPDDPELGAELIAVEYGYALRDGRDTILLEKKVDMKKRGLPSPDKADALALTFAYPVNPSDHRGNFEQRGGGHQISYDSLGMDYVSRDLGGRPQQGHAVAYDPLSLDYLRRG